MTRTVSAPAGVAIFFPILNAIDIEANTKLSLSPGHPGYCDLACAFGWLTGYNIGGAGNLTATLDGSDLLTFLSYRQTSTDFFDINLPIDNVFGFPDPYNGLLDAVSDGYWIALAGLALCDYTLTFGGTFNYDEDQGAPAGTDRLDVIVNLRVVPEPATLALLSVGIFGIAMSRTRKKI